MVKSLFGCPSLTSPENLMMHPLGLDNLDFEAYRGTGRSFMRIKKLREETLVLSYFATGWYQIRRLRSTARQRAIPAAAPISENEFEELAGLRKAQGWGTPMFPAGAPEVPTGAGPLDGTGSQGGRRQ
jgi:hypothetical protein